MAAIPIRKTDKLSAVSDEGLRHLLGNRSFTIGTIAAKTTADPDLKTTTIVNFCINGKLYAKAATAAIDVSAAAVLDRYGQASAHAALAAGSQIVYLLVLDA